MAIYVKDNPKGCIHQDIRGERSCQECYYSFVKNGQWHGLQSCFNRGECLVLDQERSTWIGQKEVDS